MKFFITPENEYFNLQLKIFIDNMGIINEKEIIIDVTLNKNDITCLNYGEFNVLFKPENELFNIYLLNINSLRGFIEINKFKHFFDGKRKIIIHSTRAFTENLFKANGNQILVKDFEHQVFDTNTKYLYLNNLKNDNINDRILML